MFHLVFCVLPAMVLSAGDTPEPFARVQAVPLPYHQVALEIDGTEIARYHYGPDVPKPFVFPLIGPAGRRVTRLTHPHDPVGHGHHLSVWVGHQNVNDTNFWEWNPNVRILHELIEEYTDGPTRASVTATNIWRDAEGNPVLNERRTTALVALEHNERYLDTTLEITPASEKVVFGKSSFGLFAVRVAKTMSVNDGGGTLRNADGAVGEKEMFWKHVRWIDYTGRVTTDEENGIAFFDHPANPNFPTGWHVRRDGWMGASFTLDGPYELLEGETLVLRYRLYVHDGKATPERIENHWKRFAEE
jgi:hypothetical protein